MSQRKVILVIVISALMIIGSYLPDASRTSSSPASSEPSINIDASAPGFGMKSTNELIVFWKERFERDPRDYISLTYLAESHIRKGRETGDVSEYQKAEAILRKSLKINASYQPTLAYLSAALFVQHDFSGALELANRVYNAEPRALQALATIGDAQLELGHYAEAEIAYEKLSEKSPSAPVYTRLARLAWLHGKPTEALSWMQRAVDDSDEMALAGENSAWYHFQLGELYFNTGQLVQADAQYTAALKAFDNYYLALAGLGKVRAAQGSYDEAITYYEQAINTVPQPEFLAALGDLYVLTDQPDSAQIQYKTVEYIGKLAALNKQVYNRQLANFYSDHDRNLDEALQLALAELESRQDIYGYDAAAWAYYKNGKYSEAQTLIERAMTLGMRDARLYYHAGRIALALGNNEEALQLLNEALTINPYFSILQAEDARNVLKTLQSAHAG